MFLAFQLHHLALSEELHEWIWSSSMHFACNPLGYILVPFGFFFSNPHHLPWLGLRSLLLPHLPSHSLIHESSGDELNDTHFLLICISLCFGL